jgi:hypothetical protein
MKIIITEDQFEKNKSLINIVNFSDLVDSDTWSPKTMVQKQEGREKYYYEEDQFVKNPISKSSRLYYLSDEVANLLNNRIHQTKEKYSEYLRFKNITDTLIRDFTSDEVRYKRG